MKPGDLVRNKNSESGELGLFMGFRTFNKYRVLTSNKKKILDGTYECAEVMWFTRRAPNGDRISTIQKNLIEVVNGN